MSPASAPAPRAASQERPAAEDIQYTAHTYRTPGARSQPVAYAGRSTRQDPSAGHHRRCPPPLRPRRPAGSGRTLWAHTRRAGSHVHIRAPSRGRAAHQSRVGSPRCQTRTSAAPSVRRSTACPSRCARLAGRMSRRAVGDRSHSRSRGRATHPRWGWLPLARGAARRWRTMRRERTAGREWVEGLLRSCRAEIVERAVGCPLDEVLDEKPERPWFSLAREWLRSAMKRQEAPRQQHPDEQYRTARWAQTKPRLRERVHYR